ncbi:MAG: hypothetical protein JWQ02_4573 [Capsulimonas sp.]|nr:hypothetical protein [Capsulimonas sp.]
MRRQLFVPILIFAIWSSLIAGTPGRADAAAPAGLTRAVTLWDAEHGLPSSKINAVAKTPDGYVWLATAEGLVRFDGLRFSVFEHHSTPSLPGSAMDDLVIDQAGTLWILAQGHAVRRAGDAFIDVTAVLGRETVNRMWLGQDGHVFLATNAYLFRCDGANPVRLGAAPLPEVCYSFADLPDGSVLVGGSQGALYSVSAAGETSIGGAAQFGNGSVTVAPDRRGGAWIASANGVYHAVSGAFVKLPSSEPLTDLAWMYTTKDSTPNLLCDADGTVWVQNGGVLFRSRNGKLSPCAASDGLPKRCERMGLDVGGRLWAVATSVSGASILYGWRGDNFEKVSLSGSLFATMTIPVYTDSENGYWIGCQTGLVWLRVQICRTFGAADGLPNDELTSIASTPGGLCVGARRSGLFRMDGGHFTRDASIPNDAHITSLTTLGRGELWVGREGGEIATFSNGAWRDFQHLRPIKGYSNIMHMAARDSQGRTWVSDGVHLFRFDKTGAKRIRIHSNQLLQGVVSCLFIDSHDDVWVGGLGGFIRVHGDVVTPYAPYPKLTGWKATSICEGKDGAIWLGFNGAGLARWKKGAVTVLTSAANGLPSDYISGMAPDGMGRFWIAGSRGISCVEETRLGAVADGYAGTATFTRIEKADGANGGALQSNFENCVTKDDQGMLWFVCEHGVIRVDPTKFLRISVPTALETVRINGVRFGFDRTIVVPPGTGDLNVEYTAIRFVGSQRLRFEYRLRGYSSRWTDVGSGRRAAYMNLPPGTYTFEVRSFDAQSVSALSHATVTIVLQPYYYQTTLFRAGCVVLALVMFWILLRLRTRLLMERTRKLEAIVEARTADLMKAHETVEQAYVQLEEQKQELEMHNDLLQNTQAELEVQNDELQSTQAELEQQNDELIRVRADLEYEKASLAEANIHLNALAITDGLTGLTNHRGFQDELEREWTRAMRYGHPLSLLLLDVDHFKQYNDTFGHPQGDKVLKTISNLLMDNCRDTDTPARYGGEEFVVIVPQTDEEGIAIIAERFRDAIASTPWDLRQVTASIGVVTYRDGIENCRDLIEYADQALYLSKTNGRNRVTAYVHASETTQRCA